MCFELYLSFFNECGCPLYSELIVLLEDFTFDEYEVPLFVFFDNFGLEVNFI